MRIQTRQRPRSTTWRDKMAMAGSFNPLSLFNGGAGGLLFNIQDIGQLFEDSALTTPASLDGVVGGIVDLSPNGHNATQSTTAAKGKLRQTAGGTYYIELDGSDDFYSIPVAAWNPAETHYAAWVKIVSHPLRVLAAQIGAGKNTRLSSASSPNIILQISTDNATTATAQINKGYSSDIIVFVAQINAGGNTTAKLRIVDTSNDDSDEGTAVGDMITPDAIQLGKYSTSHSDMQFYGAILRHQEFTAAEQSRIIAYFRSQGANV